MTHAAGSLAPPGVPPRWHRFLARVLLAGDVPIGRGRVACCQPENRFEGNMSIKATVVAEDELVEVGVDVLTAKTMIGPETPALQEGE